MSMESAPPLSTPERMSEPESSDVIRSEALNAIEKTLKKTIDQQAPRIPEKDRVLEPVTNQNGENIGLIERIRKPAIRDKGGQDLWMIVDFDDVLNHTTTFHKDLFRQLTDPSGISVEKLNELYEQSKVPNEVGKKVFRFSQFVETVKAQSTAPEEVEKIVQGLEYGKFVDQGVKRALIASRLGGGRHTMRISILTYGDPEYQKMRIDKTDLADVVDDVIYTESSKREVITSLLKEYQPPGTKETDVQTPFVMTIDDSPEHIDDYEKLPLQTGYANIRFYHPQAKRYNKPHSAKIVVTHRESSPNEAALNVYKAALIATHPHAKQEKERIQQFVLGKPEYYDSTLDQWGGFQRQEHIRYRKEGNHIMREFVLFPYQPEEWNIPGSYDRDLGEVLPDGTLSKDLEGQTVYWKEFIQHTKPSKQ